jgi:hypothetical protein
MPIYDGPRPVGHDPITQSTASESVIGRISDSGAAENHSEYQGGCEGDQLTLPAGERLANARGRRDGGSFHAACAMGTSCRGPVRWLLPLVIAERTRISDELLAEIAWQQIDGALQGIRIAGAGAVWDDIALIIDQQHAETGCG